ncbi:GMP reductase [Waddlia chondrophila 2032/99]|uniref:GMP reductase n=2 Tax=Waddlia chondrophila TaxID=71667 RepID=D6YVQ0_WADCW|nr:GMP reductase [Waddlia chondrophila]ADI38211.1 Guanosine 5'-monophosphate oxidoreductase [Waddlia chondrophila WSU 86-1044]CCB90341.1 GMP reductase [Waddlia chondrophila 2032/99]
MRIEQDLKLDFVDVLIKPKRSTLYSRKDVDVEREFHFRWADTSWTGIPIIASNMDTIGTIEMAKAMGKRKMLTAVHKFTRVNDWSDPEIPIGSVMATTGINDDQARKTFNDILKKRPEIQWICVDIANGYTERFVEFIDHIRESHPKKIIVAGNVVTGEMTEQLILAGADIVKVGIGPGSVCTTRRMTGVGYPQLSAVIECADAAHGIGGHIISDGGCIVPGDIPKAFGAGADFVMLGGMLSGHDECLGNLIEVDGKKLMEFYGMSSDTAMKKHFGGVEHYRSSEGKTVLVGYKGAVDNTLSEILGGLRSACTYAGAKRLKDLPKCTTFIRVNRQLNNTFQTKNEYHVIDT